MLNLIQSHVIFDSSLPLTDINVPVSFAASIAGILQIFAAMVVAASDENFIRKNHAYVERHRVAFVLSIYAFYDTLAAVMFECFCL